jgi:hypothetical protein
MAGIEVDAEHVVAAALSALADRGELDRAVVAKAIGEKADVVDASVLQAADPVFLFAARPQIGRNPYDRRTRCRKGRVLHHHAANGQLTHLDNEQQNHQEQREGEHKTQTLDGLGFGAPPCSAYVPVMDRSYPDTVQTEMARLLDECAKLGRENARLCEYILHAIDILDGNAKPIDWRDKTHPELLRKLCEHLEAFNLKRGYILSNVRDHLSRKAGTPGVEERRAE